VQGAGGALAFTDGRFSGWLALRIDRVCGRLHL